MSILIKDINILTQDKLVEKTNIYIEYDRISYIGERTNFTADTVIEGRGRTVMPGFVNAHTHAAMVLMRGYADGLPLQKWLFDCIFPIEDKLCDKDIYWGTKLAILEMLSTGTVLFNDMYFFCDTFCEAVKESGIKVLCARGLTSDKISGFENDVKILENIKTYERFNGTENNRIHITFGPHAIYTCTPEYIAECAKIARQYNVKLHIHLSETETENSDAFIKYGKTPTEFMRDLGVFDTGCIAAHCVHLTENDMEILKQYKVDVVYNPESNLKLSSGIAPMKTLYEKGINLCIGTDGASSNNNLNMIEEMHTAALLSGIPTKDIFKMATQNGARALGFYDTGDVKEGMKADIIIVDTEKPHYYPKHDMYANMVYSAQGADVDYTIVDGKVLYKEGEYLTLDAEKIKYEVMQAKERLFG